ASRQMNQSQPTLSRRLLRLEDELKTQLFHRSPKGLSPTEIAKYIVSKAQPLDQQLGSIRRYIELATQLERGMIRIGIGPIIEQILIPEVLIEFAHSTGDVEIEVVTEDDIALLTMFEASELDVVIGPFDRPRIDHKQGIFVKPILGERIITVARINHPIFNYDEITLDVIGKFPWAVPKTRSSVRAQNNKFDLIKPKISSDNYNLLRRMYLNLDVISGGPRSIFEEDIKAGLLREVDFDIDMEWQSILIVRPETLSTPLVQHFVSICERVAKEINDR
ncbi:MAG: LysR family transcriptional regulator, partial [Aquisalinus sp.]|nr:LysR family transcriptional regulator [Aquisalinus sp.]